MKTLGQSLTSFTFFLRLVLSRSLHLSKKYLGKQYRAPDEGIYEVFIDTLSAKDYKQPEVTLVVGFRLFLIGNNPFFHWLFQHLCILDTPIWIGFTGFKEKFWMVDNQTKNYLGIYRYQGKENAQNYAEYICALLKPLSTKGSVWYKIVEENFESFISKHKQ